MFDDTHQRKVDTSLSENPTQRRLGPIDLRFVFRRNRTGDKDRDGNPLIYALKGMNGYQIVPMYRQMFLRRAEQIVAKMAGDLTGDFIMPVPSGHSFCEEFSVLLSEWLGIQNLASDFLGKKTIEQVLDEDIIEPRSIANKRTRTIYASQLAIWRNMDVDRHISMKELDPKIRHLFQPMTVVGDVPQVDGARIIIVDDLMSTGTSISSVGSLLTQHGATADQGVCFLSGL